MALHKMKDFLEADNVYFAASKKEITAHNHHMLINGCLLYAAVLIFYTIMTSFVSSPGILRNMYYIFDVVHAVLCIFVFKDSKKSQTNYKMTQFYSILLEMSLLGFFALEAAFTSKTQHSLYVPIAIILVLLLFIHKAAYSCAITFIYVASYALLSYLYKIPEAYINDLYIAIATLISANIGYVMIAKMRHNEATALRNFENLSRTDPLTGLLNKAAMEVLCEHIMAEPEHPCAFIVMDLDDFKSVNDAYGHDVGDEVLCAVSRALQASFRGMDRIGRFGGDEFIVLMDNCQDLSIAEDRTQRVIDRISKLSFSQSYLSVQCCAGITMKQDGDTFQTIFKRADMALYEAKSKGSGSYRTAGGA